MQMVGRCFLPLCLPLLSTATACVSLYYFPLSFSQFKMAALSSAESPPPVFNGDTAEREPGREQGLVELGAGLDSSCTSGIPGGPQDEEVSARRCGSGSKLRRGHGLRAEEIACKSSGYTGCNMDRGGCSAGGKTMP